jgi:cell division protein FtsI/penicillin-binding protein 2
VISPYAARQVRHALEEVVSAEGTGAQARLASYTAGGKTGTAQKSSAAGYLPDRFYASFVGFFPVEEPEICIAVALDEPQNGHTGGGVAAPVFRVLAEQIGAYLGIPPDKPAGSPRFTPGSDMPALVMEIEDPDADVPSLSAVRPVLNGRSGER